MYRADNSDRFAAEPAVVTYNEPPSNSLVSMVLRASRERFAATRLRSTGVALMVLPMRDETRLANPRLGSSVRMLDGAIWIRPPIQFKAIWVFINCEATMVTTRLHGWAGDKQRMGSRAYGVRAVRYCPGSAAPASRGMRMNSSAH
ncbi:hypothetical protein D3C73_866140 [compost metagenome]